MKHMTRLKIKNLIPVTAIALLLSGCAGSYYLAGERFYQDMAYSRAVPKLEKAISMRGFPEAKHMLADAYRLMNNSVMAEKSYKEVIALPDANPQEFFYCAQSMMENGNYSDAKGILSLYLQKNANDNVAKLMMASCDSIGRFMKDSAKYLVEDLSINSGSSMAPIYYDNGLVFTSDRNTGAKTYDWTGKSFLELYYAKDNGEGNFSAPELLKGTVNGIYHDGPAAFSADGSMMYFTRNNYVNHKEGKSSDDEVLLKIYSATKDANGEWGTITEMPFNNNEYSCGHPAIANRGATMYFVSNMPGGQGGSDIWMVKKEGEGWGAAVNLGATINTNANEMFPYMHNDSTLFYSSDGLPGMGGLDIYSSQKTDNGWTNPLNIGYPINTSHDDFGYILDKVGEKGYFTSNRESSDGSTDKIYRFSKPELKFTLSGIAVAKSDQTPIPGVTITLLNKKTGRKETTSTAADGTFKFDLNANTDYAVSGNKDGYFSKTENISTLGKKQSEDMVVTLKIEMEKIELNKPIVLNNIYYDFDKANIRPDAAVELDKLVKILNDNPSIKIELSSHTDCRGTDPYNQKLSQARAESAVAYIISKGISKDRITAKGYGERVPVAICSCDKCTEEQHQENRRTEFKVLGFLDLK